MAGPSTGADYEAAKVVEANEQDGSDGENEKRLNIPETGNYFILYEILEE